MPTHAERRTLPHSARQMFDLVADVAAYPDFLPWCAAARVSKAEVLPDGSGTVVEADLVISFKLFREKFRTRVTLHPQTTRIEVEYLDGPFRHLNNHWHFTALDDRNCEVDFYVDFEFRSAILQKIVGLVFYEAMQRIVSAFERRADDLYSTGGDPGQEVRS